jgi:hypothetical protein
MSQTLAKLRKRHFEEVIALTYLALLGRRPEFNCVGPHTLTLLEHGFSYWIATIKSSEEFFCRHGHIAHEQFSTSTVATITSHIQPLSEHAMRIFRRLSRTPTEESLQHTQ